MAQNTLQRTETYQSDDDEVDSGDDNLMIQSQEDPTLSEFKKIISRVTNRELSLKTSKERETFLHQYKGVLQHRTRADQTILHIAAEGCAHKILPRLLLRGFPSLPTVKDSSNRTPLYLAITVRNHNFIDVVLERAKDVDDLLGTKRDQEGNCIHLAIRHNLAPATMLKLISKASETTLCAKDQNFATPLHLAVEYARCKPPQLDVVRELIAKGDKALDELDSSGRSVYLHHVHTLSREHEKARSEEKERAERGAPARGIIEGERKHVLNLPTAQLRSLKEPSTGVNDFAEDPRGTDKPGVYQILDGQDARQKNGKGGADKVVWNEEYARMVGEEVKLHYLRTTITAGYGPLRSGKVRDQRTATRFLHGANPEDISLCFDYSQCPPTISMAAFEQSYSHMHLDEVLRYVAFGAVELEKAPSSTKPRLSMRLTAQPEVGRGRSDLTFFFGWLSKQGVRSILKVAVDELQDKPHCDEAIEKCLKPFKIEILDWRRPDLCPETISNACPGVRELCLRWSGSRAVLRAWSEPEGLPRLPSLKKVYVIWNTKQVLESKKRTESNLDAFRARMKKSLQSLQGGTGSEAREIVVEDMPDNIPSSERVVHASDRGKPFYNSDRGTQGHKWLDCMDKFADEIQNVEVPKAGEAALMNDITIALIDDGLNLETESLRGKVIGGDTFDSGFPGENGPSPYHVSRKGHGTVMADLICRVFPLAKLYVFKLEAYESPDEADNGRDLITAQSAALAVDAAVERNVDIISMSWTVKETRENDEGIEQLRAAVGKALGRNILLFCAAGDTGAISEVEYPHSFDPTRMFRIGAAQADGRLWEATGNHQFLDFILPGHRVVTRNPREASTMPGEFKENTGSSVATALAAGLAGLILHCVRLGAIYAEKEAVSARRTVKVSDFTRVKASDKMKLVLRTIGLDESQRFIEVWRRFETPATRLKAATRSDRLEVVAELARDLVSCIGNL